MSGLRSRLAAVSALGMVAAGALTTAATTSAEAAAAPPTIKVFVTKHHVVHMTTHMHPGVHRFGVRSGTSAGFQLVQVRRGYSKRELSNDVRDGLSGNQPDLKALKRFERNVTLLGGVSSRPGHKGVMFADLKAGTYWAVDTMPAVPKPAKILTVHVGGRRVCAAMPHAPKLRAINETDWSKAPRSIPRSGLLTFRNDSADNHFVGMSRLLKGKTVADFRRWINATKNGKNAGPPPVAENTGLDTGVVSPGHEMTLKYSMPRGRYIVICWWPDADMGGMPHAFMGMYRGITVK